MTGPTVSVVIPTRNRAGLLARSVRSALLQDVDCEVIVVNDGSDDGTAVLLAGIDDRRLRVIDHREPLGPSASRNDAVDAARGQWVAFLDDDDLWAPDKLGSQLRELANSSARWSSVGVINVDTDLRVVGWGTMGAYENLATAVLTHDVIPAGGSGVVVDRDLLGEVGGFDPGLSCAEDWDLWIRLAQCSDIAFIRRPLMAYRLSPASGSNDVDHCDHALDVITRRYADLAARAGVGPDLVRWEYTKAAIHLRRGERTQALSTLARLGRADPDGRRLAKASALALLPFSVWLQDRRARRLIPPAWRSEAEAWLALFR